MIATTIKFKKINHLAASTAVLLSLLFSLASCHKEYSESEIILVGKITSYNEFGAAMLDFTEADMTEAGFTLGDVISITVTGKEIEMPYYDGYYTRNGEYLCVAYPTYPSICFTANNIGLPEELSGLEGYEVVVKMKEKGGKADVQQALSMKYTNNRTDYPVATDALLEGLCGATYEEIVDDYLVTYDNYYHKTPEKDSDVCNALVQAFE